jgi:GWxTD domain-containing protein
MIALLIVLMSANNIEFYTDPIIYKTSIEIEDTIARTTSTQDIFYVEFNCEIPYHELHYQSAENIIFTNVIMPFKIFDLQRPDSLVDTVYRQFTLPSFSYAAKQQVSFVIQFGTYLPEGNFKYRVEALSGEKKGMKEDVLEIHEEDYRMSDILLSSEITVDTVGDYLIKGNLRVIPRPSHSYDTRFKNLCFYYELYEISPDAETLTATYRVSDKEGKTVRKISRSIEKLFPAQAMNCGINIESFEPGDYSLSVTIGDDTSNVVAQKEVAFTITRPQRKTVSYQGMPYYDQVQYFLSSSEYREFENLPDEGKKRFLDRFWQTHDYYEIADRFEYANQHYRHGGKSGSETDRGRIHIKYGPPDEIDLPLPIEIEESRPYEHWQYPNGDQFIFVDIHGTNDYVLVWTDALDERSQPTLYRYLPPEKADLIR